MNLLIIISKSQVICKSQVIAKSRIIPKSRQILLIVFSVMSLLWLPTVFATADLSVEKIRIFQDIEYAKFGDRGVYLDVFAPKGNGDYPGVVLVHGGGWVQGKRQGFQNLAVKLAEKGYVVANIDYRLATEALFPAAVLDTKAAIRWLRKHEDTYQVDPDNIFGIGGSAGGHLIAMAGLTQNRDVFSDQENNPNVSGKLNGIIIMGTGVDQVSRVKKAKDQYVKNSALFFGSRYAENPEIYALGSPITHITENTPPILMLDGSLDRPGERYVDFIPLLNKHRVPFDLKIIEGAKHGQWGRPEFIDLYIEQFDRFLQQHQQ